MNWYYAVGGQQAGPVDGAQFDALVQSGTIRPDTLVWREGLSHWQPYSYVRPAVSAPAPPPVSALPPQAALAADEVVCAECNRIFPKENTIQYGNVWVCAACKPLFVQRLKEGVAPPGVMAATPGLGLAYAGFWIRVGAKFIDGLILGIVLVVPMLFIMFSSMPQAGRATTPDQAFRQLGLQLVLQLAYMVVSVAFNTFFLGKYGATPGKMACGLKVVAPDGAPITYARALGRSAAEILSGLICNIGYIIAAFDDEKRSLHDHIATTRVVRK